MLRLKFLLQPLPRGGYYLILLESRLPGLYIDTLLIYCYHLLRCYTTAITINRPIEVQIHQSPDHLDLMTPTLIPRI